MRPLAVFLLTTLALAGVCEAQVTACDSGEPVDTTLAFRFEDYSSPPPYQGAPSTVLQDSSADADRFHDRLLEGIAEGPDFAGRYRVVTWGCGTACLSGSLVNVETGEVHELPHASEWTYELGSRLMVLDGPSELWEPCKPSWIPDPTYLVWTGTAFEKVSEP